MLRKDVIHSPTTYKRAHQKLSIIRGLLNGTIKRKIMGRLGRSLEREAFENWGQQHLVEELIFQPHLLLQQSKVYSLSCSVTVRLYFPTCSLFTQLQLNPPPHTTLCPPASLSLPPSPAGVLTHKPQQVQGALGRHSL